MLAVIVAEPPNDILVPLTVSEELASLACANVPELILLAFIVVMLAPLPTNVVAVITLPAKLAFASRATTLLAVAASVASTAKVVAVPPLKSPPVKYAPLLKLAVVFAVIVAEPPNDILVPLTVKELFANLA